MQFVHILVLVLGIECWEMPFGNFQGSITMTLRTFHSQGNKSCLLVRVVNMDSVQICQYQSLQFQRSRAAYIHQKHLALRFRHYSQSRYAPFAWMDFRASKHTILCRIDDVEVLWKAFHRNNEHRRNWMLLANTEMVGFSWSLQSCCEIFARLQRHCKGGSWTRVFGRGRLASAEEG